MRTAHSLVRGSRIEDKVQPRRILETFNRKKICIAGHRHYVIQRASSSSTSRSFRSLKVLSSEMDPAEIRLIR
jgi:hypothetical protein